MCRNAWVKWINDSDVTRYSEQRLRKHTKSTQLKFLRNKLKDKNSKLFAIYLKNQHIGILELSKIDNYHKFCQLIFFIGEKKYWRKGFGTLAVNMGLKLAFNKYSVTKVFADTYGPNLAGRNVFLKSGFKIEGKLKNFFKLSSKRVDKILYGIDKKKFFQKK